MVGFIQICLSICLLIVNPAVGQNQRISQWPVKYVSFHAQYDVHKTLQETCARYYGRTFLDHMTNLSSNGTLTSICKNSSTALELEVIVTVIPKVTAVIKEEKTVMTIVTKFQIALYKIPSVRSRTRQFPTEDRNATITDCKDILIEQLITPKTFRKLVGRQVTTLEKSDNHNCTNATMSGRRKLVYTGNEEWVCQEANYKFEEANLTCVADVFTTVSETQSPPLAKCIECVRRILLPDPTKRKMCTKEKVGLTNECINETISMDKERTAECNRKELDDFANYLCNLTDRTTTFQPTSPSVTTATEISTAKPFIESSPFTSGPTTKVSPPSTSAPQPTDWKITLNDKNNTLTLEEGQDALINVTFFADKKILCPSNSNTKCEIYGQIHVTSEARPRFVVPRCWSNKKQIAQLVVGDHGKTDGTTFCQIPINEQSVNVSIPVRAKMDGKYEQSNQMVDVRITMVRDDGSTKTVSKQIHSVTVVTVDRDTKATCQSINDPHITTFDGLQYNNFYEGEFVLYKHTDLGYQVNVIFQKCSPGVQATCNCGVAVKSGDDVIVFDKCRRKRKVFQRPDGSKPKEITILRVQMFLNNDLTPSTKVYQANDGKLYHTLLPHGSVVKVMVNDDLLNVWVMASPKDREKVKGLCGDFNGDYNNDAMYPNGTVEYFPDRFRPNKGQTDTNNLKERWQPNNFSLSWRRGLKQSGSIYEGVTMVEGELDPKQSQFCECFVAKENCGPGLDVETCDKYDGIDITQELILNAIPPIPLRKRRKRQITVTKHKPIYDEPIVVDRNFTPPKNYGWRDGWTEEKARRVCEVYLTDNAAGEQCAKLHGVDYEQELLTCVEDIRITASADWANSALDALKEQCMEEIKSNTSFSEEIGKSIQNSICPNQCFNRDKHGTCVNGTCRCRTPYTGVDCSVNVNQAPYVSELPAYGLCDVTVSNCSATRVYGQPFADSSGLKCKLQPIQVPDKAGDSILISKDKKATVTDGKFINYNTVECPVPDNKDKYYVQVTNNGRNYSGPLMFVPYNPLCYECSTNTTTCIKVPSACELDGICYKEGEEMPGDHCIVCLSQQWRRRNIQSCEQSRDVLIFGIVGGAVGSLIGLVLGILIYKFCCKRKRSHSSRSSRYGNPADDMNERPMGDYRLHRNRNLPEFDNIEEDLPFPPAPQQHRVNPWGYPGAGRGVENGVDDTTYF